MVSKTLTALSLVHFSSVSIKESYLPTLVVVPANLIHEWKVARRFGAALHLRVFYGSKDTTANRDGKELVLSDVDALRAWHQGLDTKSSGTGRSVVLTTYETWAKRTTVGVKDEVSSALKLELKN